MSDAQRIKALETAAYYVEKAMRLADEAGETDLSDDLGTLATELSTRAADLSGDEVLFGDEP